MYVNVQRAAARLGVSVVTIRRWTASGFLPCTRTPGGHRRFNTDDLDELARMIGGSETTAAKAAREREFETVVKTALAFGSKLELPELLAEIARQVTQIIDVDYCTISEVDEQAELVRTLADYDRNGRHFPADSEYALKDFPLTGRVIEEQMIATVDVDDRAADPAEVALLKADGDRCMLMIPLVHKGTAIGMLEVIDHERSRKWSRQELRLLRAMANEAAMAVANARAVARIRGGERELDALVGRIARLNEGIGAAAAQESPDAFLEELARAACAAFGAISCVVTAGGRSAGASGPAVETPPKEAHVLTASDRNGRTDLTLTLTLPEKAGPADAPLLELATAASSAMVAPLL